MPKQIQPLSDIQVKNANPAHKEVKLFDGGGLFLFIPQLKVDTNGKPLPSSKLWRFKYRFAGKEKLLSFGAYPAISLAEARQRREDAKKLLARDVDPSEEKKQKEIAKTLERLNTFEAVTRQWFEDHKANWSENHAVRLMRRLEADIFPLIGDKPIVEVRRKDLTTILQAVSIRTLETAHRLKIAINQMLRYALQLELITQNPLGDTKGLLRKIEHTHMAAPTDPKEVAPILRAIDGFTGSYIVKCAMQLAPMLFVRPGELRHAEWLEIDLETAEWNIPAEKMKMKVAHLVPLPEQAVMILQELKQLTGHSRYVFPCHRSPLKCMSDNTVNAGLRRLGFDKSEITGHGFRAIARTLLDEVLGFRPDIIEHQLAHAVKDPNGRAYNRTSHLQERRKMMIVWADYLDGLKYGAKVLPFKKAE